MKKQLIQLIYEKAFKYSEEPVFKLVSGRMSNYYFNCKAVTLHPEGMYLIGNIIFDMIQAVTRKRRAHAWRGPNCGCVAFTSYLRKEPGRGVCREKNRRNRMDHAVDRGQYTGRRQGRHC
jgi:orotate phosphoribosyltransferase